MAYIFGDGFDCYAAPADAVNGYWDSGTTSGFTLVAGRFSGSQALQSASNTAWLVKSSGQNDALHHIVCAFQQTATLTGSGMYGYFQLSDAATNQVCVVFRQDGAIVLTSATPGGTALATYTGAVTATSTWYAFEIEVFISATAGYMNVRKNGNVSNDFTSATNLNTRPGTNSYANKLTIGYNALNTVQQFDDILWRSDASSVPWVGDIRCFTRRPVSDASVQWTPNAGGTNYTQVDETQQNAATDYVFSSTVGNGDLYGISAISSTPASVVAVTTRAYLQKSDAGTRNVAVQLRSGATTVQGTSTALNTTWSWLSKTDLTDPATGAAWTAVGVSNCNIGVIVTA